MDESKTYLDRFNAKLKNNKIFATLVVIGTIVMGVSSFTNAAKNLVHMAEAPQSRPAINGQWRAQVAYDWPNANYTETFTLGGEGENLHGSASFLSVKRGIVEGKVTGGKLEFITKTQEALGDASREVTHRYTASVSADELRFVMQTEGSASAHVPVEFVAHRAASAPAEPKP